MRFIGIRGADKPKFAAYISKLFRDHPNQNEIELGASMAEIADMQEQHDLAAQQTDAIDADEATSLRRIA